MPVPGRVEVAGAGLGGTLLVLTLLSAGCAGDSGGAPPTYTVRVTAKADPVILMGCAGCPARVQPHGFFEFVERRTPPLTYRLTVRGKTSRCPTLEPYAPIENAPAGSYGRDWSLTIDRTGSCVRVPFGGGF